MKKSRILREQSTESCTPDCTEAGVMDQVTMRRGVTCVFTPKSKNLNHKIESHPQSFAQSQPSCENLPQTPARLHRQKWEMGQKRPSGYSSKITTHS
jgi:DNA-binding transcriptional regulator YiaG